MDNDELRLREQEIKEINMKMNILIFKIGNYEEVEKIKKSYRNLLLKLIPIFVIARVAIGICVDSIPLDIYSILGKSLGSLVLTSVPCFLFHCLYSRSKRETSKLKNELYENNKLLLARTNYLNELKNKNNKKENVNANDNYKNINYSNSLVESKTSGKTRIRKREK